MSVQKLKFGESLRKYSVFPSGENAGCDSKSPVEISPGAKTRGAGSGVLLAYGASPVRAVAASSASAAMMCIVKVCHSGNVALVTGRSQIASFSITHFYRPPNCCKRLTKRRLFARGPSGPLEQSALAGGTPPAFPFCYTERAACRGLRRCV